MTVIRRMVQADVKRVASCARLADVEEIKACCGLDIEQALHECANGSLRAWVIEQDGKPLAAVGDTMAGIGVGVPWMVTTTHIEQHPRAFLRASREVMADMQKRHLLLVNFVDARNADAIRWLSWLGAHIEQPAPYGVAGLPFRKFTKKRED
jgi:hypothetical protein